MLCAVCLLCVGLYHFRILLPPSYPMSAPDIILLTPNGRFELGKKICIDGLTSFHAGSWQPAWGVRTAIYGLRSFWMQGGEALSAIGALDYSKEERKRLAHLWVIGAAEDGTQLLMEQLGKLEMPNVWGSESRFSPTSAANRSLQTSPNHI
jgi:hypothetical protein